STHERQRYLYALTPKGNQILDEWLAKPVELEQHRNELLLKLFFGSSAPLSLNLKHIEEHQRLLTKKKILFSSLKEKLQLEHRDEPNLPYWLITLDYGLRQVEAGLDWCESSLNSLKIDKKLDLN